MMIDWFVVPLASMTLISGLLGDAGTFEVEK